MHPLLTAAAPTLAAAYMYARHHRNGSLDMPSTEIHHPQPRLPSGFKDVTKLQMQDWLRVIINELNSVAGYIKADNPQRALLNTSINKLQELQADIFKGHQIFYVNVIPKTEDVIQTYSHVSRK